MRAVLLKMMLFSYGFSAILGIVSALTPFAPSAWDLLGTALTFSGVLTLVLIARVFVEVGHRRLRRLMDLAWISAVLAGAFITIAIWGGGSRSLEVFLATAIGCTISLSLSLLHIGYLFYWRIPTVGWARIARWGLLAINLFLLSQLELLAIDTNLLEDFVELIGSELYARVVVVCIILLLCGTAALPITYLVVKNRYLHRDQGGFDRRVQIPINCPRCGFESELKNGESTCPQCKLAMILSFEEPRCGCGYLLYRVEADHCPECGRSIPDHQRWAQLTPNPVPSG